MSNLSHLSPEDPIEAPRVPWTRFLRAFRQDFKQGQHVSIYGPTDSGKTTVGIEVCDCREYVLFLATKNEDDLISGLHARGYRISERLEIESREGRPVPPKIVYWPRPSERKMVLDEIAKEQSASMSDAMTYAYHSGGWCVFADEVIWLNDKLKLRNDLEHLWYHGRSSKVSLVAAAQRPAWTPRAMRSSPHHIFLFQTNDHDDLASLGDIGGTNVERIKDEVPTLASHEFLYVGTRSGVLLRSKVER